MVCLRRAVKLLFRLSVCWLTLFMPASTAHAQPPATAPSATAPPATPPPASAQNAAPQDALGRDTPRGTVLGFLSAARRGDDGLARQYLDTKLSGAKGDELAHQLFVVLDARLPARLSQISDDPEGSRGNPLTPNADLVGAISSLQGSVDVIVNRIDRGKAGHIWLFSNATLETIPTVYAEIMERRQATLFRRFLAGTRTNGVRLFEWLTVLLGLIALYVVAVPLNRLLTPLIDRLWGRLFGKSQQGYRHSMRVPARLLVVSLIVRPLLDSLTLSLFVRQFWTSAASLVTIATIAWLLILLNGEIEHYIDRRVPRANASAFSSLLRLVRRAADALIIIIGVLATLRLFAIDATPALAGLGVGGIAVALAAQKTLENLIAGASLIFDQAVRVGDSLKVGDISGTVDHIGLRSTRIRTLDRTVVSIPNGQIANASLETLSARDKFWFHPVIGLRYQTTSEQLHNVVDSIRRLLDSHSAIDSESVRVRFFRLGPFSLDIDVFAYLFARDYNHFLEIQEKLLFDITEAIGRAGTEIAFPSQMMYLGNAPEMPRQTVP